MRPCAGCCCSWGGKCQFLSAELGWGHLLLIPSSCWSQSCFPCVSLPREAGQDKFWHPPLFPFHPSGTHLGEWGEGVQLLLFFNPQNTIFLQPLPQTIAGRPPLMLAAPKWLIFSERLPRELESYKVCNSKACFFVCVCGTSLARERAMGTNLIPGGVVLNSALPNNSTMQTHIHIQPLCARA